MENNRKATTTEKESFPSREVLYVGRNIAPQIERCPFHGSVTKYCLHRQYVDRNADMLTLTRCSNNFVLVINLFKNTNMLIPSLPLEINNNNNMEETWMFKPTIRSSIYRKLDQTSKFFKIKIYNLPTLSPEPRFYQMYKPYYEIHVLFLKSTYGRSQAWHSRSQARKKRNVDVRLVITNQKIFFHISHHEFWDSKI